MPNKNRNISNAEHQTNYTAKLNQNIDCVSPIRTHCDIESDKFQPYTTLSRK